jgi:hypothetical protein
MQIDKKFTECWVTNTSSQREGSNKFPIFDSQDQTPELESEDHQQNSPLRQGGVCCWELQHNVPNGGMSHELRCRNLPTAVMLLQSCRIGVINVHCWVRGLKHSTDARQWLLALRPVLPPQTNISLSIAAIACPVRAAKWKVIKFNQLENMNHKPVSMGGREVHSSATGR